MPLTVVSTPAVINDRTRRSASTSLQSPRDIGVQAPNRALEHQTGLLRY